MARHRIAFFFCIAMALGSIAISVRDMMQPTPSFAVMVGQDSRDLLLRAILILGLLLLTFYLGFVSRLQERQRGWAQATFLLAVCVPIASFYRDYVVISELSELGDRDFPAPWANDMIAFYSRCRVLTLILKLGVLGCVLYALYAGTRPSHVATLGPHA